MKIFKLLAVQFLLLSGFFISTDLHAKICYPSPITGLTNYPISVVDNGNTWYGRIAASLIPGTADVFSENPTTGKIEFMGNYAISALEDHDKCRELDFRLHVFGETTKTTVTIHKNSDTDWWNKVRWKGPCYGRDSLEFKEPFNCTALDFPGL